MYELVIEEREWSEDARRSWRRFEGNLVDAIRGLDSTLWEDLVRFLNRHWNHGVVVELGPITVDEDGADFVALFWMGSKEREIIWCELHHYELGDPIGLTLYIRNPEK